MTSSGRYQSKLFNLFSRSLSQLAKLQPRLRRLKVGAVWGAQVLFYLARSLIQTGFGQKQGFQQLVAETDTIVNDDAIAKSQSPSIASSDRPIQQTLLAVEKLDLSSSKNATTTPAPVLPAIQGVATQLTTRTLVLVTAQNELLLLSPQQQKLLHQRILWEVVNYGWAMRLAQAARLLGRIKIPRVSFLPPTEPRLSCPGPRQVRQLRVPLKLGLTRIRASFSDLAPSPPRDLEVNPGGKGLPAKGGRVRFWQQPTPTDQAAAITDELTIRALIRAAIAYFFSRSPWHLGRSTSAQIDPSNPKAFTLSGEPQFQGRDAQLDPTKDLSKPSQTQPWLTLSNLFGVDSNLVTGAGAGSPSMVSQPAGVTQTQLSPQPHPVVNGEWIDIETEATLTGYIKHPLEQVLDWLDRSIAWLEGIMVSLRNRLQAHVAAFINLIQRRHR